LTQQDDHQVMSTDLRTASGNWNVELIREVFCHFDTESILRINSRIVGEDFCSWEKEKHGMYSVRSAYRLLEEGRRQAEDTDVPGSSDDKDWKILWKFEVPPKVRVFWWRVLHGFLPARQVLYRRHIERIANCEICGAQEETIKYVLMDCSVARKFWDSTKELTGVKLPSLHDSTWARDLL
jgi:hypothetical protein